MRASAPQLRSPLVAAAYALTAGLTLPAVARSLTDQEARHIAETVVDARNKAFAVLSRRRIVERTFAWLNRCLYANWSGLGLLGFGPNM